MSEIKHTPTPWTKDKYDKVLGANGRPVNVWGLGIGWSSRDAETQGNSELIFNAVNSHASLTAERDRLREENERLTKALAKLVKWHGMRGDDDELLPEHKQEAEIATAMALLDRGAS